MWARGTLCHDIPGHVCRGITRGCVNWHLPTRDWLAIVRAWYTMENGPNGTNGKKGKHMENLPGSKIREWTKAPGSESAARICPRKSPPKRGLWESYFLQGVIGKTHTQNLQILREDTLGATCSAGPQSVYFRKMGKKMENRTTLPFFTIFDRGKFSMFLNSLCPIFAIRPVFYYVPGPHDCKDWRPPICKTVWNHAEVSPPKCEVWRVSIFETRKGIPKNLSSQVLGEVRCELFGVYSYQDPSHCESKVRIVQTSLWKASDDSLLLKDSFGPRNSHFGGWNCVGGVLYGQGGPPKRGVV